MAQQPAAFSRSTTMTSTNWADDVEEDEAEMQRVESMQGLSSPRLAHPGSPLAHGAPTGYPEEERGGGPYGGGGGYGGHGSGGYGPPLTEGPPLPDRPPFKAYLGNIPYDLDEEVVSHFFRGLDIVDIIITRHHDTGKPKGCFVEFGSQDHLAKALTADGEPMLRRPIRIQVAEPPRRDRDGFGDRRSGFGRRGGYEDRRGGYEDRRGGYDDRRGGGFPDRGSDRDRDWPSRRGPPGGDRDLPTSPRERPKLVLQPRSSEAPADSGSSGGGAASGPPAEPKPRSNPFGDAKPIDTQSKLAEFEERLKQRKKEEAEARQKEKEAAAAAVAEKEEQEKQAAAAADKAAAAKAAPPASAAAAVRVPPPPPAAAKPAARAAAEGGAAAAVPEGAPAAATADGHEAAAPTAGRGRGGGPRVVTVPARGAGRGAEGGRGRGEAGRGGGRGRGGEHGAGEGRRGRSGERPHAGGRSGGRGEGGRGGRGAAHAGRQQHHEERQPRAGKADHKTAGPVPDHLRARGYILDDDEVPKTKIDNPFDALNLADD